MSASRPTTPRTRTRCSRRSSRSGRRRRAQRADRPASTTPASASSSAFGGPCNTPTFERLAADGLQVHPLPHDRAVLADAGGAAHRPQPSLGRHGRHHRDRHLRARLQLGPAQEQGAAGRDAQAQRLLARPSSASATRCRSGRPARWARSTAGRTRATASSTSTASSAARPTSTRRRSTATPCRSSRTGRRRRATTSPRT